MGEHPVSSLDPINLISLWFGYCNSLALWECNRSCPMSPGTFLMLCYLLLSAHAALRLASICVNGLCFFSILCVYHRFYACMCTETLSSYGDTMITWMRLTVVSAPDRWTTIKLNVYQLDLHDSQANYSMETGNRDTIIEKMKFKTCKWWWLTASHPSTHPRRCKTSLVGQSTGLFVPSSPIRFRHKLQKSRTQIYISANKASSKLIDVAFITS